MRYQADDPEPGFPHPRPGNFLLAFLSILMYQILAPLEERELPDP
jgi:hypothetical protein